MARRKAKTEDEKTIPEIADEVARKTVRGMYKDGKLTAEQYEKALLILKKISEAVIATP